MTCKYTKSKNVKMATGGTIIIKAEDETDAYAESTRLAQGRGDGNAE